MLKTQQSKIGSLIKSLREKKGLTQIQFAKLLGTTQSSIARMEKGEQNLTTETIQKVSDVLDSSVINLADPSSIDFKIEGGRKLQGEIYTNTSKNGALGLMCASLLNKGKTTLYGIPKIEEVYRIIEVLTSIGVSVKWNKDNSLQISPPENIDLSAINQVSARKTRTIIMFIGPLIHLFKQFHLPNAQGCKLGTRTIAAHIYGMEELGVKVKVTDSEYIIDSSEVHSGDVTMYEMGDTATENIIMLAAKIPGKTTIRFAASNYMVQDVCFFLQKLGIHIEGVGTSTLVIHGVENINANIEHWNSEDPVESMTFLTAGIVTKSSIVVKRAPIDFLTLELYKLKKMGLNYRLSDRYKSHNERTDLVDITVYESDLIALEDKIHPSPYPGINIDNLPFFSIIATQTSGRTLIHDWVYEERAIYFLDYKKLGANVILADPHRVYIEGPTELKATQLVSPPALRPSVCLLIGMMAASGISILRNVYSISRGYEDIAERLNKLGARVEVLN